jgi:hypothetical protein
LRKTISPQVSIEIFVTGLILLPFHFHPKIRTRSAKYEVVKSGKHRNCGPAGRDAVRFGVLLVTNVLEESYDSIFRVIVENT